MPARNVRPPAGRPSASPPAERPRRKSAGLWWLWLVLVVALGGAILYYFGFRKGPPETAAQPKPEPKPPAKPETKAEVKTEVQAAPKPETKAEVKIEVPAAPKPEPKPETKPEVKPETKAPPATKAGKTKKPPAEEIHPAVATVGMKSKGRHGDYSRKAAQGPHMKVVAATFFGGGGCEEFVDAAALADGTIVAFGNAWGPEFPSQPAPAILGRGQHTGGNPMGKDAKGNEMLDDKSPNMSGMMVFYSEGLQGIKKVVKFDWGVANILAGMISGDGNGLVVAGRCHAGFKSLLQTAGTSNVLPYQAAPPADPKSKKKAKAPADPAAQCDVYVARFSTEGKPQWVWVLEKNNDPPDGLFSDESGAIYFDAKGLHRLSSDGREHKLISPRVGGGQTRWLGVHPKDGSSFFGGDRNTSTGREPYRNPFLDKYDANGQQVWTLWNFPSREIGQDDCRLVSDSAARSLGWTRQGDMIVGGWSDGGNSVFPRQATNWRLPAKGAGMGMQTWGMKSANSLGHIMVIDPQTKETKSHTWWASFVPDWFSDAKFRGAPNAATIKQICVLDDASVAITGGAATGLIQTPGAFWEDPMTGDKYGGCYVAVFRPDLTNVRFSSYMPGCASVSLGAWKNGVVAASRSQGKDHHQRPTATPTVNALQKDFGGGTDAHLLLLQNP